MLEQIQLDLHSLVKEEQKSIFFFHHSTKERN